MFRFLFSLFQVGRRKKRLKEPDFPPELLETRTPLGPCGERVARWYLENVVKLKFIEANARIHVAQGKGRIMGELDLIMEKEDSFHTIVFVEVRTRAIYSKLYGTPAKSVNRNKQVRVCTAARRWLRDHGFTIQQSVRFDVVSIIWENGKKPEVCHIPAAFPWVEPSWRNRGHLRLLKTFYRGNCQEKE